MAYLGITVVLMVVVAISSLRGSHPEVGILLSAGVGGASVGMQRGDAFGLDGPAFYLDALSLSGRRALRSWFAGQNAAVAAVTVPLIQALAARFGGLIVTAILVIPVIVAIASTGSVADAVRIPALIAVGAVYGALLAWAGIALGAGVADGKLPELFQLAARSKL
jgi:hypothetical protein